MKFRLLEFVIVALFTTMHLSAAVEAQHPDKRIGSKTVIGRLISYQEGDYAHVSVRSEQGREQTFFVGDEICFLALHREEVLVIEYDEIERFFPEGDGYFPALIIQSIATSVSEKRWIKNTSAKPTTVEQNECARVLRATLKPSVSV
jgi:hypothetical protein